MIVIQHMHLTVYIVHACRTPTTYILHRSQQYTKIMTAKILLFCIEKIEKKNDAKNFNLAAVQKRR